jgi:hypothetical protein
MEIRLLYGKYFEHFFVTLNEAQLKIAVEAIFS